MVTDTIQTQDIHPYLAYQYQHWVIDYDMGVPVISCDGHNAFPLNTGYKQNMNKSLSQKKMRLHDSTHDKFNNFHVA